MNDSPAPDPQAHDGAQRFRTLLEQAGELARLLLKSPQAPRTLTSEFLHGRKRFTAADRAEISAAAYHVLRIWRPAEFLLTGHGGDITPRVDPAHARAVCASAIRLSLADATGYPLPAELTAARSHGEMDEGSAQLLDDYDPAWRSRASWAPEARVRLAAQAAVAAALPDWIARELETPGSDMNGSGVNGIGDVGRALCTPAPLTLRVALARISREDLLQRLHALGISAAAHPLLPAAIVVEERIALTESALYADGLFEVQDAGSQLIGYACDAAPGSAVFDACAGGGGKSMHLLDLMEDRGRLLAADIERNKLRGLRQRAARIAASAIDTLALTPFGEAQNPSDVLPPHASFDCVLVDAPCSGFGTVRRNPALKWRLQPRTVARLASRQLSILSRNAAYVRPGGVLVYATCSLLPQENRAVLDQFISAREGFSLEPLQPVFERHGFSLPGLDAAAGSMTVHPALLDSDGFFLARMRRE